MTLPIETILPLNPTRLDSKDPAIIGDYVSELVNTITTMYQELSQATNGDYREFSPQIFGLTTPGNGTYAVQQGYYLRKGLMVDYWFNISWTAHSGSGFAYLLLPYKVRFNNTDFPGQVYGQYNYPNTYNGLFGLAVSQTFREDLYAEGSANIPVVQLTLQSTGALRGHIRYIGQEIENG